MIPDKNYQGILFDFDGVLSQSMEDNFKAWEAATAEYGLDIKKEDYFPLEGMTVEDVAINLFRIYSKSIDDIKGVTSLKEAFYLKFHKFKLYPGVTPFIDWLVQNKIPIGIVTGAQKSRIVSTVKRTFLEKFNTLVTGDVVTKGKPFPDPYIMGSELLGISPEECIIIENAPLGIKAAKACNAYCIAISSTLGNSFLREADTIVECFAELRNLNIIKDLGGSANK